MAYSLIHLPTQTKAAGMFHLLDVRSTCQKSLLSGSFQQLKMLSRCTMGLPSLLVLETAPGKFSAFFFIPKEVQDIEAFCTKMEEFVIKDW